MAEDRKKARVTAGCAALFAAAVLAMLFGALLAQIENRLDRIEKNLNLPECRFTCR
jgi:hypothetical protein